MKKLALGLVFVGLAACESKNPGMTTVVPTDPDADTTVQPCNPLAQTGCNTGEKCTWIEDQENPPIGHVGCAPEAAAPKAIGDACMPPPPGPMGYDDCVKGAVCLAGVCKQVCDVNGGAPACDANHSCTRYADFFEVGGNAVAGVCDPACDPLTQDLKIGTNKTACGSPTPATPNSGCYGYDDYSCAPVGETQLPLTDRMPPRTDPSGNPYLNGCAPGYLPFFFENTGSTTTLCSGFCAALEIDDTQPGNNQGDALAEAKLPTEAAPAVGNATCSAVKKGSSLNSSCRFMYPYVQEDDGSFFPAFESTYLDTLGICFEYTQFNYDHDMNTQTPNEPYPNCGALPKRSAATPGDSDDAADWGCQKLSNSMFAPGSKAGFNPALKQVRLPKQAPMELVRHSFH